MAAMAESRMNLSALQQRDPYITGIVDTASQVALYSFNFLTNEWEKTDVEGTLFVYTRLASPVNGFLILNRLGLNDLVEPINKNLEFQLQDPFLLYRNGSAAIYGIWFYDKDECARIGQLMNSLVQITIDTNGKSQDDKAHRVRRASESEIKLEQCGAAADQKVKVMVEQDQPMAAAPPAAAAVGGGDRTVNIMEMLSKARDEYDKSEQRRSPAVPTQEGAASSQPAIHILDILARAKAESEKFTGDGGAQPKQSPERGYRPPRDSPKSKGKGKTSRKHAPKPMIDNPNASATKSTNILRPLPLKPNSSTADLEDDAATSSTSITLDALFKSTQDDKKTENKSASPLPVMGMPPLLQRLMSQPGSSMLEDIERQSYPQLSPASAELIHQQGAGNGASVPKMPSPPKTMNAVWSSSEPDSPNTAIKRTLNMLVDNNVESDSKGKEMAEKESKPVILRTASMPVDTKSAPFWNPSGQASQTGRGVHQVEGHTSHISSHNAAGSAQSTAGDSVSVKLRDMTISNEKLQQGIAEQMTSPLCSSDGHVTSRVQQKAELKLNTSVIAEESQPELVTPQALLEKAAFPGFTKTTPYSSSQTASDSSTSSVLLTPMAFETSRCTPPLNPTQLTDTFLMQRNSISGDGGSQPSPGSHPIQDKSQDEECPVSALTKQQLQQALVHLLKNDSNFLTAIHEAYVQSLHQELRTKSERL